MTERAALPTALLVPVPAARALLEAANGHDAEAASGLPPHITILYPFVNAGRVDADLMSGLADVVSGCAGFPYRLEHVRRFPDAVAYLAPDPPDPFIAITETVWARWPSHPPYQGAYETIVPHVTIVEGVEPPDLEARIAPFLPLEVEATEVLLLQLGPDDRWTTMARFPLGPQTTSFSTQ